MQQFNGSTCSSLKWFLFLQQSLTYTIMKCNIFNFVLTLPAYFCTILLIFPFHSTCVLFICLKLLFSNVIKYLGEYINLWQKKTLTQNCFDLFKIKANINMQKSSTNSKKKTEPDEMTTEYYKNHIASVWLLLATLTFAFYRCLSSYWHFFGHEI